MNDIEYLQSAVDNNYESGEALRRIAKILKQILLDKEREKEYMREQLAYYNLSEHYSDYDLSTKDRERIHKEFKDKYSL